MVPMAAIYSAIRVAVVGKCSGQDIVNVFNVAGSAGITVATQVVGDEFAARFKSVLSNSYAFDHAYGVDMSSPVGATYTYSLVGNGVGGAGASAEVGLAAVIRWQDSISGRGFRTGRTFLGPLPSTSFANTGLETSTAARTAINAAAAAFISGVNAFGTLVMPHGVGGPAQQLAPITGAATAVPSGHLDSRRR